ncbi:MAG: hypothetical protein ACLPPF_13235 [Rhodomicrobium sp.]
MFPNIVQQSSDRRPWWDGAAAAWAARHFAEPSGDAKTGCDGLGKAGTVMEFWPA